jgi:hypothetical protein
MLLVPVPLHNLPKCWMCSNIIVKQSADILGLHVFRCLTWRSDVQRSIGYCCRWWRGTLTTNTSVYFSCHIMWCLCFVTCSKSLDRTTLCTWVVIVESLHAQYNGQDGSSQSLQKLSPVQHSRMICIEGWNLTKYKCLLLWYVPVVYSCCLQQITPWGCGIDSLLSFVFFTLSFSPYNCGGLCS